jgi:hypothetical protein
MRSEQPNLRDGHELHRWARRQRSAAIGRLCLRIIRVLNRSPQKMGNRLR